MRLRIKLNPLVIPTLYRNDLKEITSDKWMTSSMRKQEIRDLDKKYAEIRRFMSGLHMVAIINQTRGTLDRIEMGGTYTPSTYICSISGRLYGSNCKAQDMPTLKYALGISFTQDTGIPVEAPTDAVSFQDLLQKFIDEKTKSAEQTTSSTAAGNP